MLGATVSYDNTTAKIHDKDGNLLLVANKADTDKLWLCELGTLRAIGPPTTGTSSLAQRFKSIQEQTNYLQLILRSRPKSTIIRALKLGWLKGWPIVSSGTYERYAIDIPATSAGNLRQLRHSTRSTKLAMNTNNDDDISDLDSLDSSTSDATDLSDDFNEDPTSPTDHHFDPEVAYIKIQDNGSHSDAKGPYRTPSAEGHQFEMVTMFDNFIYVVAMKTPNGADQFQALQATEQYFQDNSAHPPRAYERYDNAGDNPQVRAYLKKNGRELQLCMKMIHRALKAERGIQDWQNFRLSAKARWGQGFPSNHWHLTIAADIIVINHLRPSASNPTVSAWHNFHGQRYDYNKRPILPAACLCSRLDRSRFKDGFKSTSGYILNPDPKRHHVQTILVRDNNGSWSTQAEDSFVLHLPDDVILPRLSVIKETGLILQDLTNTIKRIKREDVVSEAKGESLVELGRSLVEAAREASSRLFFDKSENSPVAPLPIYPPTSLPHPVEEIQPPVIPIMHLQPPPPHLEPEPRLGSCIRSEGGIGTTKQVTFQPATATSPTKPTARSRDIYPPHLLPKTRTKPPDPDPPARKSPRKRQPTKKNLANSSTTNSQDHSAAPQRVFSNMAIPLIVASALLLQTAGAMSMMTRPLSPIKPPHLDRILANNPLTVFEKHHWKQWLITHHQLPNDPTTFTSASMRTVLENTLPIWGTPNECDPSIAASTLDTPLNLNSDGSPLTWKSARQGPNQVDWWKAKDVEWDRLFTLTETCLAVHRNTLPPGVIPTYFNDKVREKFKEADGQSYLERRVRTVLGGDRITTYGPTRCNVAETELIKAFYNSVVSDNAEYSTADMANFYYGTPLPANEQIYASVPVSSFSPAILDKYNLHQFINNNHILLKFLKTIPGLPNAGILSKQRVDGIFAARGYHEDELVPCVYRHVSNRTLFLLVVDDMAIKYYDLASRNHLLETLTAAGYGLTVNDKGTKFVGLTVNYNREQRYIDISMPDYAAKVLKRFGHRNIQPCDSPILYEPPIYGEKSQRATDDPSPLISDTAYKEGQEIVGCGLWYARMVDSPTLTAISSIATELSERHSSIEPKLDRYLGYLMQYPTSTIRFHASDMNYIAFGDVSHNSVSKGRSRAGGYGFYGWNDNTQRLNGAVFTMSNILDVVTASAAEGEYGAAYMVARHAVWMRAISLALGHPQQQTTIWCDNTVAVGLSNDTLKIARTKSIDLRFHWLRDRIRQEQFKVQWVKSEDNIADFFTKALPVHQHIQRRNQLVIGPAINHRAQRALKWRSTLT